MKYSLLDDFSMGWFRCSFITLVYNKTSDQSRKNQQQFKLFTRNHMELGQYHLQQIRDFPKNLGSGQFLFRSQEVGCFAAVPEGQHTERPSGAKSLDPAAHMFLSGAFTPTRESHMEMIIYDIDM